MSVQPCLSFIADDSWDESNHRTSTYTSFIIYYYYVSVRHDRCPWLRTANFFSYNVNAKRTTANNFSSTFASINGQFWVRLRDTFGVRN